MMGREMKVEARQPSGQTGRVFSRLRLRPLAAIADSRVTGKDDNQAGRILNGSRGFGGAEQATEKPYHAVILTSVKDRALNIFKARRDSSFARLRTAAAPLQKLDA
jgi:hypothetical protein